MTHQRPSLRRTWLPLGLSVVALAVLNLGLYGRLSSQMLPAPEPVAFPYREDFSSLTEIPYSEFGGDWELRDGALVQLDTNGYDLSAFIPMDIDREQPYQFAVDVRFLGGSSGGGLIFNAQQSTSRQKSHMVRFNAADGRQWLIYGYFGDDSNFMGQGSAPLDLALGDTNPQRLSIEVSGQTYRVLLNGTPLTDPIPLLYLGGSVGFISAASQVAFDNVVVEPLAAQTTAAAAPPTAQPTTAETPAVAMGALMQDSFDAAADGEPRWQAISGEWVLENGTYTQRQTAGFDLSTLYQQTFAAPYTLQADLRHEAGTGGGVLFSLPQLDSVRGGHMVRYIEDGSVLTWGYFDSEGAYIGQGSASITPPGDAAHRFEVQVDVETYTLRVDGVEVAAGVPRYEPAAASGIGLTASQSAVAFDQVDVMGEVAAASTVPQIDSANATGDWRVEGDTILQSAVEETDYIVGTGTAGEQFAISVDVLLPADSPTAGAGIVFHMSDRSNRVLGTMVRFGSGGSELFWGHYGEDNAFVGEGGVQLQARPGETRTLRLIVRAGSYDILVDGEVVAPNVPLATTSGWIGLISFSGPVEFSNVQLALGA